MITALIFAGGTGERMHTANNTPKQFLRIYNKPIIIYTLEKFENCKMVDNIVVVCLESWIKKLEKILKIFNINKVSKIIPGGKTGFESRFKGLEYLIKNSQSQNDIVLLHDGVRPIIESNLIEANIATVKAKGNAITIGRATETISLIDTNGTIKTTLDRNLCRYARAPQSFYLQEIFTAYEFARNRQREDLIDSASILEYYGKTLYTVEGPDENIKITTPMDFYIYKGLLQSTKNGKFKIEGI